MKIEILDKGSTLDELDDLKDTIKVFLESKGVYGIKYITSNYY